MSLLDCAEGGCSCVVPPPPLPGVMVLLQLFLGSGLARHQPDLVAAGECWEKVPQLVPVASS